MEITQCDENSYEEVVLKCCIVRRFLVVYIMFYVNNIILGRYVTGIERIQFSYKVGNLS